MQMNILVLIQIVVHYKIYIMYLYDNKYGLVYDGNKPINRETKSFTTTKPLDFKGFDWSRRFKEDNANLVEHSNANTNKGDLAGYVSRVKNKLGYKYEFYNHIENDDTSTKLYDKIKGSGRVPIPVKYSDKNIDIDLTNNDYTEDQLKEIATYAYAQYYDPKRQKNVNVTYLNKYGDLQPESPTKIFNK